MRWSLPGLVCLTAAPALACPTADDLRTGILVVFADGAVDRHTGFGNEDVRVEVLQDDQVIQVDLGAHGACLLNSAEIEPNGDRAGEIAVSYPDAIPGPTPSSEWIVTVTESHDGGADAIEEAHVWHEMRETTIGGGLFAAYDGVLTRRYADGDFAGELEGVEMVTYLPEHGFGFVAGAGLNALDLDLYDVERIEAVE
ncbi:hypothetical protein [Jannaschia aquimarina]|uniref:Uncharacterized protein n=1 Tax=Jannaschia aquimarina TaxID=935700 RepID=A0A0D1EGU2_9RHOB|nr:hypothetical protein [Jannaschia aquimarina]KIT16131.1 hypothetical protein jaqu_20930 [Jannaschia aquimarina]SNT37332.1 hypothetical protein SAMN05421775_11350 [Jannaschia aquimarina]